MSVFPVPLFRLDSHAGARLVLRSAEGHVAEIFVLEPDIVRVVVLPHGVQRLFRTWAIAPGQEDVPDEGRERSCLDGYSLPAYELHADDCALRISTQSVRLTVRLRGLHCEWEISQGGQWLPVARDRGTQAYNFGFWDERVYHYLARQAGERYFGLGERAGELDRAGQRFRLCNVDAMGYSARTSDPLYKHIPFYLTVRSDGGAAFGLYYDTVSDCTFDFGKELDNYHGPYRSFVAENGDLDFYFIAGPRISDVVTRYTWLTGRPAFPPRWCLGYSGSTMAYTDAPNAQERMGEFLSLCAQHDILCDSFHLSSGYTTRDGKRYVFHWDRKKFPDPKGFVDEYLRHGVRLCANVKPCLLRDHPRFAEAEERGLFIQDEKGQPHLVQFWDEVGAYLDFTNPATAAFWEASLAESLLAYGVAATWNDNNEFEIWSPRARIHGFGMPRAAIEEKPVQTLLMLKASQRAQRRAAKGMRLLLISRAGAAGMQRYVQTWSGDNYTSWETLRYNLRMGLGLSLSGVSNSGHDVGGFAGPAPEPELFLRWVQLGVFFPRFSIHSWNTDGTVNEPWMYPELVPAIRALFRLRYRLLPYLYDLLWRAHRHYEPMMRPTLYDFAEDARCFEENDELLLGGSLLVVPVVEPGQRERRFYLPAGTGWYDFFSGRYERGGQVITVPAPLTQPVVWVREGAAIPLNVAELHFAQPADARGFAIFPLRGPGDTVTTSEFFEDDGETESYRDGRYGLWQVTTRTSESAVALGFVRSEPWSSDFPTAIDSLFDPREPLGKRRRVWGSLKRPPRRCHDRNAAQLDRSAHDGVHGRAGCSDEGLAGRQRSRAICSAHFAKQRRHGVDRSS